MRILLVEDDPAMAEAVCAGLRQHGMLVDVAPTLLQAEAALRAKVHDMLLLDRHLPDGEGIAFIAKARSLVADLPVIVMTARGELKDRVAGLDLGADDYLVKPIALDELLARIRAVQRRPSAMALPLATVGRLAFDFVARQFMVGGERLALPRRQLLVLEALVYRQGRTVRREALQEAVYEFDDEIQSNALDAHISKLRRVLSDAEAGVEIHVIRGVGYLLKAST